MRRLVGAALAALITALTVLGPAAARAEPAVSVPVDDAVLPGMPASVRVTFDREPVAAGSYLSVLDPDGSRITLSGTPAVEGNAITQPTSSPRTGVFAIVYHVAFTDGGREGGLRHFTVDPAAPPSGGTHAHGPHGHSVDPLSATLLVVDGLVVLGAAVLLMFRRRHPRPVAWRLSASERTFDDQPA
jgi:methionine-rich copper-binding protein CopC